MLTTVYIQQYFKFRYELKARHAKLKKADDNDIESSENQVL